MLALKRQLPVLYVVKSVLKMSSSTCAELLASFGNPEQWGGFCTNCSKTVESGWNLLQQINQLQRQQEDVKNTIKRTMQVKLEAVATNVYAECPASLEIRRIFNDQEPHHGNCSKGKIQDFIVTKVWF